MIPQEERDEDLEIRNCVGFAALKTFELASFRRNYFIDALERADTPPLETGIDPYMSDAARFAAMSHSGFIWDAHFNRQKSRIFWEWWLDIAVAEAWRRALDSSN